MMKCVEIKCGRDIIWVSDKDYIYDNGSIVQIMSQYKIDGWHKYPIRMSKALLKDFIKCGFIYTNESIDRAYRKTLLSNTSIGTFYKFHIEDMIRCGYNWKEV